MPATFHYWCRWCHCERVRSQPKAAIECDGCGRMLSLKYSRPRKALKMHRRHKRLGSPRSRRFYYP